MTSSFDSITRKRLANELKLLEKNPEEEYDVVPDPTDTLTWYFLIIGQKGTPYHGGYYIGKMKLSPEFPAKPGDFYMLTPSGRFMVDQKICITISSYHPEGYSASWTLSSMVSAFQTIMNDDKDHGLSHIFHSEAERREMCRQSFKYNATNHSDIFESFTRFIERDASGKLSPIPLSVVHAAIVEHREKKKEKDRKRALKKEAASKNNGVSGGGHS